MENPTLLHVANYSPDHNHRELDGHSFWKHTYRLAPVEWVLLRTLPTRPVRCQIALDRASDNLRELATRAHLKRHIRKEQRVTMRFPNRWRRWTIAQKFWIISTGSHTVYCVLAAELF